MAEAWGVLRRVEGADRGECAAALLPVVKDSGLAIILEPGRNIVAPAGALLSRVVDVKDRPDNKVFIILDAGMTELIRPMLYGAFHRIEAIESTSAPNVIADIVGPLCESSDTLGKDRRLARPRSGPCGGFDTAHTAPSWPRITTAARSRRVLVDGANWSVIRRRQTIRDLLSLES